MISVHSQMLMNCGMLSERGEELTIPFVLIYSIILCTMLIVGRCWGNGDKQSKATCERATISFSIEYNKGRVKIKWQTMQEMVQASVW